MHALAYLRDTPDTYPHFGYHLDHTHTHEHTRNAPSVASHMPIICCYYYYFIKRNKSAQMRTGGRVHVCVCVYFEHSLFAIGIPNLCLNYVYSCVLVCLCAVQWWFNQYIFNAPILITHHVRYTFFRAKFCVSIKLSGTASASPLTTSNTRNHRPWRVAKWFFCCLWRFCQFCSSNFSFLRVLLGFATIPISCVPFSFLLF